MAWTDSLAAGTPWFGPVPAADALGSGADTLTALFTTPYVLPADALGSYADADATIVLHLALLPTDGDEHLHREYDSATVDLQEIAVTPLTADCPADAWETLADAAPTIAMTGAWAVEPPADAFPAYGETLAVAGMLTALTADCPADARPAWTDSVLPWLLEAEIPYSDGIAALLAHRADFAVDDWGTLADALAATLSSPDLTVQATDSMTISDTLVAMFTRALAIPADAWGTLADGLGVTSPKSVSLPADANAAYADSILHGRGLLYRATDDQNAYADAALLFARHYFAATDPLAVPADVLAAFETFSAAPGADTWALLADSLTAATSLPGTPGLQFVRIVFAASHPTVDWTPAIPTIQWTAHHGAIHFGPYGGLVHLEPTFSETNAAYADSTTVTRTT